MRFLKYHYLLSFLFAHGSLSLNNNLYYNVGYTPYNKYELGMGNPSDIGDKKNIFNIKNISNIYVDDVTKPKIIDSTNEFDFDTSPECLDLVKSKYSCIKLENKDFKSYCEKLKSPVCTSFIESDKSFISSTCNISLAEAEEFVNTINELLKSKKFFCLEKNDNKKEENNKQQTEKDKQYTEENNNDNITGEKIKDEDDNEIYCPITLTLQNGYLKLIKEGEEKELNVQKRKRSPVISNVNSFIPSSNIDTQIIKKRLVEDLKKNCKYDVCRGKVHEYLHNIRNDFSYFNVIYQYKVNDDSLRDNIIKILNESKCSGISPRYSLSIHLILIIIGTIYLLL